ncbi:MAG: SDR family NAD(P)-dependent oxidoreductase [Hyphomonadaceae bacterium]|nr:SDR family NAD(P)-dependent oxidoreductase [Hyphomonadaceae bacterium]
MPQPHAQSVLVAGVGPGLGAALARAFAAEGFGVAMLARRPEPLAAIAAADADVRRLLPIPCDLTDPDAVEQAFTHTEAALGPLACAIHNAGTFAPAPLLETSPAEFERCWRTTAFAGFLVGQAAARRMAPRGAGSILFTGATASLRGGARFATLASPKFALRALAQSMAREFGPQGVHVAHVIIDGLILAEGRAPPGPDAHLDPAAIAQAYVHLHRQPRSAWTQELDLRPWSERF